MSVVLVTGAAGGLGAVLCERFAAGGWDVVATDRPDARAATGDWVPADLLDVEQIREMVAQATAIHGRLDCVVNAAGLWTEGASDATREEEWDRVVGVNLKAAYFVSSAAIPHLEATGGSIVMISSDAGIQGNAGAAVYSASKGGVVGMTLPIARDLASLGIRVNTIVPGLIDTPLFAALPPEVVDTLAKSVLYPKRLGRPAEIAHLAVSIVENDYINGECIRIDGGIRMQPR